PIDTLVYFPFFFSCSVDHRDLHSFPTRRSSDLWGGRSRSCRGKSGSGGRWPAVSPRSPPGRWRRGRGSHRRRCRSWLPYGSVRRSEEHTSELQSQSNLVCRLLLEKKKKHRTGSS